MSKGGRAYSRFPRWYRQLVPSLVPLLMSRRLLALPRCPLIPSFLLGVRLTAAEADVKERAVVARAERRPLPHRLGHPQGAEASLTRVEVLGLGDHDCDAWVESKVAQASASGSSCP